MQAVDKIDPELDNAVGLYKSSKYKEALPLFIAIECNPFSSKKRVAEAQFYIGRVYLKFKDIHNAVINFKKASSDIGDIGAAAMYALGDVYFNQSNFSEAEHYLSEAVDRGRKDAEHQLLKVKGILKQLGETQQEITRGSIYIREVGSEIEQLKRKLMLLVEKNEALIKDQTKLQDENNQLRLQLNIQELRNNQLEAQPGFSQAGDEDEVVEKYHKLTEEKKILDNEKELFLKDKLDFELLQKEFEKKHSIEINNLSERRANVEKEYCQIEVRKIDLEKRLAEIEMNLINNENMNEQQVSSLLNTIQNLRAQASSSSSESNTQKILNEIKTKEQDLEKIKNEILHTKQSLQKEKNELQKERAVLEARKKELADLGATLFIQERNLIEREKRLKTKEDELEKQRKQLIEHKSREVEALKVLAKKINDEDQKLKEQEELHARQAEILKKREQELKMKEKQILKNKELYETSLKMLKPTPLREAIESKKIKRVTSILDNCIHTINEPDSHGRTALHWAAMTGDIEIIKILIIAGAKCNIISSKLDDDKYAFECLPKKALFSKEDKYQKIREKMKYLATQHQKLQSLEELKYILDEKKPLEFDDKIKKTIISCMDDSELLEIKNRRTKTRHADLLTLYGKYSDAFRLVLDATCSKDDQFLTGISVEDLINDFRLLKKYGKDQNPEYINSAEVARELFKRIELILICKRFGKKETIQQILALVKIRALDVCKLHLNDSLRLHKIVEKVLFETISTGINPALDVRNECIKLLEYNQYKQFGNLNDILNSTSKCELVLMHIRNGISTINHQLINNQALESFYLPLLQNQAKINTRISSSSKILLYTLSLGQAVPDASSENKGKTKEKVDNSNQNDNKNHQNGKNIRAATIFSEMPSLNDIRKNNVSVQSEQSKQLRALIIEALAEWDKYLLVNLSNRNPSSKVVLSSQVRKYNFDCHDVPSDGACFFHAIAHQLSILGRNISAENIRASVVDYLLTHQDDYQEFITDMNKFITNLCKRNGWADHIAIQIASKMLNINIVIIRSDNASPTIIEAEQHDAATVYIGYEVGLHYQSLTYNPSYGQQHTIVDFMQNQNSNKLRIH